MLWKTKFFKIILDYLFNILCDALNIIEKAFY
jgi:hypothetical protein